MIKLIYYWMVTMKHVLIISYSFPPLNNIAARRFGEMVGYMEQFGWRPYIITTESQGILPLNIKRKQCISVGIHPQTDKLIQLNELPGILETVRNVFGKINFRFRAIDRTMLTWGKIIKEETDNIINRLPKIDLVIASYGPAASLWLGRHFADKYNVPWIADFRDLAALRRDDRPWLAYKTDRIIERNLLKTCSGITTVSKHLAKILSETYGKPCETIYNGWSKQSSKSSNNLSTPNNYVYYAGQFYMHRMNAVYYLLEALTHNESICLKIRSLGPLILEKKLMDYTSKLGITDRVEILPPASQKTVEEEAEGAIANVVVEDMDTTNQWAAGTLTGKFLQLLPGAVPIMSIARHDNEMGKILELSERGRLCSAIDQIEAFLIEAQNEPERFAGDIDVINEFSKKKQTEKLCSFFDVIRDNGDENN